MIERSVFNRRKRKLFLHLENIRKLMVAKFNEMETTFYCRFDAFRNLQKRKSEPL